MMAKSRHRLLEEVSTTCGSGWVVEQCLVLVGFDPTRYRWWY
jgi:hypothetical protein